jgi:hypothetical protein
MNDDKKSVSGVKKLTDDEFNFQHLNAGSEYVTYKQNALPVHAVLHQNLFNGNIHSTPFIFFQSHQ